MSAPLLKKATLHLERGNLYIPVTVYECYFSSLEAVILLSDEDNVLVLPVQNTASGGYLLKVKNAAGDRLISAPDFFANHELLNDDTIEFSYLWDQGRAALRLSPTKIAN